MSKTSHTSHTSHTLHVLTCSQCNEPLSYSLYQYNDDTITSAHCYLCMLSFCELATILAPSKFPDKVDIYANTGSDETIKTQQRYRSNCIKMIEKLRSKI